MRALAIPLGVFGCLLMGLFPAQGGAGLGLLLLMFGALAFIRGHRLEQARIAAERHQETLQAIREGKAKNVL